MRFRNIKPRGNAFGGNSHTPMVGRDVRSRLFVPMDGGRRFEQVPLGDRFPNLRTIGADGTVTDTPLRPSDQPTVEWEMPGQPAVPMPDTLPPENFPKDVRPGGVDRPEEGDIRPVERYTVTGSSTSRSLNVLVPTAANVAQVLSALLADLSKRGVNNIT